MLIIHSLRDIPANALRIDSQGNGSWNVYFLGDVFPDIPGLSQAEKDIVAAAVAVQNAKDVADTAAAKQYAKLQALLVMTPAQVQAWVAANVTNLAQAQDAIATLATATAILARKL